MSTIKLAAEFTTEVARELADVRATAAEAQSGIRTLRDVEMGWVGGGDGQPVLPY